MTPAFVEKGSPQQNRYLERFNGTMRDELLNGELFDSLLEARVVIEQWVEIYNHVRPHARPWHDEPGRVRGHPVRGADGSAYPHSRWTKIS